MNLFLEKNYFIKIGNNGNISITDLNHEQKIAAYFSFSASSKKYSTALKSLDPKIIHFSDSLNNFGIQKFYDELPHFIIKKENNIELDTIDFFFEVYKNLPITQWNNAPSIILDCLYVLRNYQSAKVYCFERNIKMSDLKQNLIDLLHTYQLLYIIDKKAAFHFLESKANLRNPNHHQLKT